MTSIVHDEYLCPIQRKTESGHSSTDDRLWAPFPGGAHNDHTIHLLMRRRSFLQSFLLEVLGKGFTFLFHVILDEMVLGLLGNDFMEKKRCKT